jgi:CRISPR/Cas system-associated exonuclease Cas4 (RecB family)
VKRQIRTLGDLKKASGDEIEEAKVSVSIIEALEEYLEWLHHSETTTVVTSELKRWHGRALGIHPSAACKKNICLLRLYYDCTGDIEPMRAYDEVSQKTYDTGTLLHDAYQTHFREMFGDQFQDEVKLRDEKLHIKSSADGVFDFPFARATLELKSIKEGSKQFGWETVQHKPMEDNVRQCHFYMKLADTPFAIILYMNKNAGRLKEYVITFDFDLWDELETEVVMPVVEAAYKGGEEVPATAGWNCRWCDYNYACPAVKQERKHVKGANRPWSRKR